MGLLPPQGTPQTSLAASPHAGTLLALVRTQLSVEGFTSMEAPAGAATDGGMLSLPIPREDRSEAASQKKVLQDRAPTDEGQVLPALLPDFRYLAPQLQTNLFQV